MPVLTDLTTPELRKFHEQVIKDFGAFRARGLKLDMTRGKPSPEQLDQSNPLMQLPGNQDFTLTDGSDARNYGGGVQGLAEARELFTEVVGVPIDQIIVANNSSLTLMHDCIVYALLKGLPGGDAAWGKAGELKFLCPVPGFDRHFAISEAYEFDMIRVEMTGEGPDMDEVERLAADPSVKAMWCVPKYSNPSGDTYSDDTIQRLAAMKTGAPDFRLFWDNAYALHDIDEQGEEILNILVECEKAGNPDRAFVFISTSKVTLAGAGLGVFASSPTNIDWALAHMRTRSIGPDKLNQLRHVRYLKDTAGMRALMERHRQLIVPKFEAVYTIFAKFLGGMSAATWSEPKGGYFISLNVMDGCAARTIELAGEAGIVLLSPGACYPYGNDPRDRHIRIAPTFPELTELEPACEGISLAILLAVSEKLLSERN